MTSPVPQSFWYWWCCCSGCSSTLLRGVDLTATAAPLKFWPHPVRCCCVCVAGEEAVSGSCPESQLLQRAMQACPYTAGWDTCNTAMCEFSTPTFIPSRVQPLFLGNSTPTVPMIYESASAPNSTNDLPFYDTSPGPVCFPDITRTPMILPSLLGVSEGISHMLEQLQAKCVEADDVVYDVARNIAACGREVFSYQDSIVYSAVGMQKSQMPPPAPPATAPAAAAPAQAAAPTEPQAPAATGDGSPPAQAADPQPPQAVPAPGAGSSSRSSSSSGSSMGSGSSSSSSGSSAQSHSSPRVATEIGYRG
jgi:hypothetical protein